MQKQTLSIGAGVCAIDINSFLPLKLQENNNYAGTSGNDGYKYFVCKNGKPQEGVLPDCNIGNEFRQDCIGKDGAYEKKCLADDSCCYQPSIVTVNGNPTPWCFKKKSYMSDPASSQTPFSSSETKG